MLYHKDLIADVFRAVNHPLLIEDAVLVCNELQLWKSCLTFQQLMFTPEELEHLRKRMQREEGCKELEIRLSSITILEDMS